MTDKEIQTPELSIEISKKKSGPFKTEQFNYNLLYRTSKGERNILLYTIEELKHKNNELKNKIELLHVESKEIEKLRYENHEKHYNLIISSVLLLLGCIILPYNKPLFIIPANFNFIIGIVLIICSAIFTYIKPQISDWFWNKKKKEEKKIR
ncbi:MAG: hypothetical protein LBS60_02855 [Deltaproteobacteria bacterium]|jgi:hypothetical protein|nr:hypothetical protein [Deltaproteobacteria bacterium]